MNNPDKELLQNNYRAFTKLVNDDFPYDISDKLATNEIREIFSEVFIDLIDQHSKMLITYYSIKGKGIVDLGYLDHYLELCYRFANAIFLKGKNQEIANAVYYSCRVRTTTDVFYKCEIGECFIPVHPLGSVIDGHSKYGKGFCLHNGVHIGPYHIMGRDPSEWEHPTFGDGVIVFAKASVYGKSSIGNNVIITPNTMIINENIPDNCIVMGSSPNLRAVPNKFNNYDLNCIKL